VPALRRSLLSLTVPLTLVAALIAPSTAMAATVQPLVVSSAVSASILDPAPGATVGGADVYVDALGSVGSVAGDGSPESLTLLVDGTVADNEPCMATPTLTSCESLLDWYTVGATPGPHTLTVELTTNLSTSAPSPAVAVTLVELPAPVVAITTPTAGATVAGNVTVTATGSVDPSQGDFPVLMGLVVDGSLVGTVKYCPATGNSCTLSFPWDANTLSGTHTLQVGFATDQNSALSPPITVTVFNPPPTASLTTRFYRPVRGVVTVAGSGAIDPAEIDSPRTMQLVVDGAPYGTAVPCPLTASTLRRCSASFSWDSNGLLGAHNLQVRFDTVKTSVLSAITTVTVDPPLSQPGQTHVTTTLLTYKGVLYAKGSASDNHNVPLPGARVVVVLSPYGGKPLTLTATTGTNGVYAVAVPMKLTVNTKVTARLGAELGSATASWMAGVTTHLSCAVPATMHHGVASSITCKAPGLLNGTKVTLSYADKTGFHWGPHANAKGGRVTIRFVDNKKAQRIHVWVTTASSPKYMSAIIGPVKVHVI
jgi:hypothetical protein